MTPKKPTSSTKKPFDTLCEEEKALLERAMRGVTPLRTSKRERVSTQKSTAKPHSTQFDWSSEHIPSSSFNLSDPAEYPETADSTLRYQISGVSPKQLKLLRRGEIPIEARLDLHGCTVEQARAQFLAFIQTQLELQRRCLLIIHGKSLKPSNSIQATLKNHVAHWLRQIPEVLAFVSAPPKLGGTGAVLVLLKRIGSAIDNAPS